MIKRIKFWLSVKRRTCPFWYKDITGEHISAKFYNMLTDIVTCDIGSRGYVEREGVTMKRKDFESYDIWGYRNKRIAK